MRKQVTTIRDVAKRAGVSVSTVSHVINGHDGHVSAPTRELILAAARDLNYRPNAIARSMVKRKTATVGLIITELQNALFIPVTEGVESVLQTEGYHILLASAGDLAHEINAIETMRAQQVDGFIIMSLSLRLPIDHLLHLREAGIPFVVINRDLGTDEINQIQLDEIGAGRMATEHLLNLGHSNIAIITGPLSDDPLIRRRSTVERYQGWREALAERGISDSDQCVIDGGYTFEGGLQAGSALAAQIKASDRKTAPTACFVCGDMMAMGVLKGLHDAGFEVPRDVAIITIGDPPFAPYTIPALTTLALPIFQAGQIAARVLVDSLKADKSLAPQQITLGPTLRIRESCGAQVRS
ncbi:MAG: LacI family DNA-binding transcriptional regulator [Anaerolineae bacterium]|nr:LacI family DNA-binding transcriptional regulator [Anaerolineae bacterium]